MMKAHGEKRTPESVMAFRYLLNMTWRGAPVDFRLT